MYFVYILISALDKTLYTGMTREIKKRFREHNAGESGYTRAKRPWKLVWCCMFPNKYIAARFEKYLKTSSGIAFINKRLVNR